MHTIAKNQHKMLLIRAQVCNTHLKDCVGQRLCCSSCYVHHGLNGWHWWAGFMEGQGHHLQVHHTGHESSSQLDEADMQGCGNCTSCSQDSHMDDLCAHPHTDEHKSQSLNSCHLVVLACAQLHTIPRSVLTRCGKLICMLCNNRCIPDHCVLPHLHVLVWLAATTVFATVVKRQTS